MELTIAARTLTRLVAGSMTAVLLVACGGGSDEGGGQTALGSNVLLNILPPAPQWQQGSYASSATYAAQCAQPRSGINPATGTTYSDRQGSIILENYWLRSWTHELYLWYREVLDRDPAAYSTAAAYFDTQKTTTTTSSGRAKDQFHFTYNTLEWNALSQSGVSAGYGVEWAFVSGTIPRNIRVAYTEPSSPASHANLNRGGRVLAVDGTSIDVNTSSGIAALNAGLFPAGLNETHSFLIQELNGAQRTVSMTSTSVTSLPVQNVKTLSTTTGTVGYLLFNDHIATAEQLLVTAFTQLKQANVSDLVLDMRYNGGGYLDLASEVAFMIAGSASTSGKTFERTVFNDQYPNTLNPVTGGSNASVPFHATAQGFSVAPGTALPALNLPRVFVLTGSGTCSASEAIINSLRGVGVTVIQIGNRTCGKPYGFYPKDNCGTTYFSVQFQGVNHLGVGDYADGFTPSNGSTSSNDVLPGCVVADDLTQPLGDVAENRLEAALFYRSNGYCSPGISIAERQQVQSQTVESEPLNAPDRPWRNNRILGKP